jgi:hypothetical protein
MLVSECAAGSAFQVTFKFARCHLLLKRGVEHQFPWQVFSSVSRMAAIMLVHALAPIMGESRVSLLGMGDATEHIDIAHHGPPSRDAGRLYNRT